MNNYDKKHFEQIAVTTNRVSNTYEGMTAKITSLVSNINDSDFSFKKYGAINKMVDQHIANGTNAIFYAIDGGVENSWTIANTKNNALFKTITGNNIDRVTAKGILEESRSNLKAFNENAIGGQTTKDRILREQAAFKSQIELAINKTLANGNGSKLGSEVKRLLNNPEELYRVPAQGASRSFTYLSGKVTGSAMKNVNRMAGNEIQRAYRESDWLRMQANTFVIGYDIVPSRSFGVCKMCSFLAGTYPKDFYFTNWHVSCRCHCYPIIDSKQLAGKGETQQPNMPENFNRWVQENEAKIQNAKILPDFITKNEVLGSNLKDFNTESGLISNIYKGTRLGKDSESLYSIDGVYSPERKALHDKIIKSFTGHEGTKEGTVHMLGGASANGKSTLTESGFLPHPKKSILVDPDAIKSMIPEYEKMLVDTNPLVRKNAANFCHEESSYLGKVIQSDLKKMNKDYILDGVNDGGIDKLEKKVMAIKQGGTRVRADYCTLDTDLSLKLAEMRAKKTGRMIPQEVILDYNRDVSKLIPEVIKNGGIFDELYLWDTNVNGTPRLILTQLDGVLKMYDETLYNRFLLKATY